MAKKVISDYDSELDILHVYSEDIGNGIKGCICIGDFNIDIGNDNKVVGVEIEEASHYLKLSPEILSSPSKSVLIVEPRGNYLFIGVGIVKGDMKAFTSVTTANHQELIQCLN